MPYTVVDVSHELVCEGAEEVLGHGSLTVVKMEANEARANTARPGWELQ